MARTVDQAAYAQRREDFLDAAQRLIQTKGYAQMSIGDVLAEVGSSKGAFYHYFASRAALLDAVIDRMAQTVAATLSAAVDVAGLSALERLRRFFAALAGWKLERPGVLLAFLRVWQSDDNAVVRLKIRGKVVDYNAPTLARVIESGVRDDVIATVDAERCARVVLGLIQDLNEELATLLLAGGGMVDWDTVDRTVISYTDALHRVLGVPTDSFELVDARLLRTWFEDRGEDHS